MVESMSMLIFIFQHEWRLELTLVIEINVSLNFSVNDSKIETDVQILLRQKESMSSTHILDYPNKKRKTKCNKQKSLVNRKCKSRNCSDHSAKFPYLNDENWISIKMVITLEFNNHHKTHLAHAYVYTSENWGCMATQKLVNECSQEYYS